MRPQKVAEGWRRVTALAAQICSSDRRRLWGLPRLHCRRCSLELAPCCFVENKAVLTHQLFVHQSVVSIRNLSGVIRALLAESSRAYVSSWDSGAAVEEAAKVPCNNQQFGKSNYGKMPSDCRCNYGNLSTRPHLFFKKSRIESIVEALAGFPKAHKWKSGLLTGPAKFYVLSTPLPLIMMMTMMMQKAGIVAGRRVC